MQSIIDSIGSFLGYLTMVAFVYYPFIRPLMKIDDGKVIIRETLSESAKSRHRIHSLLFSSIHFVFLLVVTISQIYGNYTLQKELPSIEIPLSTLVAISLCAIVTLCFCFSMILLFVNKKETDLILKLGFIIMLQSLLVAICFLAIFATKYSEPEGQMMSFLFLGLASAEIYYLIYAYRFNRKYGIKWETKSKSEEILESE